MKKEGKYGVLDTQGRTVLDFNYDEIFYDEGNTFTVKTGNKQEKLILQILYVGLNDGRNIKC